MRLIVKDDEVTIDGAAMLEALQPAVARRVARFRESGGAVPTLGLVAVEATATGGMIQRWVDLKHEALTACGIGLRATVLPSTVSTVGIQRSVEAYSRDPGVHAVFIQYPLPHGTDAQLCADVLPLEKDVDGGSSVSRARLVVGSPCFPPVSAVAIRRFLEVALPAGVSGAEITIVVGGSGVLGPAVAKVLLQRGASVVQVPVSSASLAQRLSEASVVIAATGKPRTIQGAWLRDGAVVIDGGYDRPLGDGDVQLTSDERTRLGTFVAHRGGLGPLTILELAGATLDAARGAFSER